MNITYNNKQYTIPKPFDQAYMGADPTHELTIQNPYSNDSVKLPAFAVAIYDTIKGAEMLGKYETMETGIAWFRTNYPKEYFILLD